MTTTSNAAKLAKGRAVTLAILVAAQTIVSLDFSLVSITIPSIERGLSIGPGLSQWVITADMLAYGGFLIVGGRIADSYGQKLALTCGLFLFMLGSLVGVFAPHLGVLVGGRIIQGLGGALTFPATISLLARDFPAGPERFRALTISTAVQATGVPLGTIMGGWLVTNVGWHAAFVLNITVCLTLLCVIPRAMSSPQRQEGPRPRLPIGSAMLLAIGLGLLIQAALGTVSKDPFTRMIATYALPSGLTIVAIFVLLQRVSQNPLISLSLLRVRNLGVCILITAMMVMVGKGLIVLSNISFQQGLHFTALEASLALLPMTAASLLLIPLTPKISGYLLPRPKLVLVAAFAIMGTFHLTLAMTPGVTAATMLMSLLFLAPFASVTSTNVGVGEILRDVKPGDQGVAAGMLYTAVQIVGGLGLSLMIATADQSPNIVDDFERFYPGFRIAATACLLGISITWLMFRSAEKPLNRKPFLT